METMPAESKDLESSALVAIAGLNVLQEGLVVRVPAAEVHVRRSEGGFCGVVQGDCIRRGCCSRDNIVNVQVPLQLCRDCVGGRLQMMLNGCSKQERAGNDTKRNPCKPEFLQVVSSDRWVSGVFQPQEASDVAVWGMEADLKEALLDVCCHGDSLETEAEEDAGQILEQDWTSVEAVVQAVVGSLRFRRPIVDDAQLGGSAARGNDRMVRQVVPAMCAVLGVRRVVLSVRGGELDDSSFELLVQDGIILLQRGWISTKTAKKCREAAFSERVIVRKVMVRLPRPSNFVATILKGDRLVEEILGHHVVRVVG